MLLEVWVRLGVELGVIWMELEALDCSGMKRRKRSDFGRGRRREVGALLLSRCSLSHVTKGVEGRGGLRLYRGHEAAGHTEDF